MQERCHSWLVACVRIIQRCFPGLVAQIRVGAPAQQQGGIFQIVQQGISHQQRRPLLTAHVYRIEVGVRVTDAHSL